MSSNLNDTPQPHEDAPSSLQPGRINIHQRSHSPSFSSDFGDESAFEPSAALILVPDDTDNVSLFDAEAEDIISTTTPFLRTYHLSGSLPPGLSTPLSPPTVLLFLLAPVPLLGAMLMPESLQGEGSGFEPKALGAVWILLLCVLAQASNQIWILLGRYVRKWSIEDVIAHALTGGDGRRHGFRERWRKRISRVSGVAVASICALICVMYLQGAVDALLRSSESATLLSRVVVTVICSILVTPFIIPTAITSKWLSASVLLSEAAYIVLIVLMVVHRPDSGTGAAESRTAVTFASSATINWGAFATTAFTSASPLFTYPLYASHLAGRVTSAQPFIPKRRVYPYSIHMLVTAFISFLFLLPWYLVPSSGGNLHPLPFTLCFLFSIPPVWVISLSPRLPTARTTPRASTLRYSLWGFIVVAACMPPTLSQPLLRLLILAILFLTYPLPATLHIFEHNFYPPLSILISDEAADPSDRERQNLNGAEVVSPSDPNSADSLLRRKERSLQRRRLGRRILWDIGVWLVLLPFGIITTTWAAGRFLGRW